MKTFICIAVLLVVWMGQMILAEESGQRDKRQIYYSDVNDKPKTFRSRAEEKDGLESESDPNLSLDPINPSHEAYSPQNPKLSYGHELKQRPGRPYVPKTPILLHKPDRKYNHEKSLKHKVGYQESHKPKPAYEEPYAPKHNHKRPEPAYSPLPLAPSYDDHHSPKSSAHISKPAYHAPPKPKLTYQEPHRPKASVHFHNPRPSHEEPKYRPKPTYTQPKLTHGGSHKPNNVPKQTYQSLHKPKPAYAEPHLPNSGYRDSPVPKASILVSKSAYGQSDYNPNNFKHKDDEKKSAIPGIAGKDYPIYNEVPHTSFSCDNVPYRPGMYANPETACQAYHVCNDDRHGHQGASFLCSNGTVFNQESFSCDWWYNVDCDAATSYYTLNSDPKYNPYYKKAYEEEESHHKTVAAPSSSYKPQNSHSIRERPRYEVPSPKPPKPAYRERSSHSVSLRKPSKSSVQERPSYATPNRKRSNPVYRERPAQKISYHESINPDSQFKRGKTSQTVKEEKPFRERSTHEILGSKAFVQTSQRVRSPKPYKAVDDVTSRSQLKTNPELASAPKNLKLRYKNPSRVSSSEPPKTLYGGPTPVNSRQVPFPYRTTHKRVPLPSPPNQLYRKNPDYEPPVLRPQKVSKPQNIVPSIAPLHAIYRKNPVPDGSIHSISKEISKSVVPPVFPTKNVPEIGTTIIKKQNPEPRTELGIPNPTRQTTKKETREIISKSTAPKGSDRKTFEFEEKFEKSKTIIQEFENSEDSSRLTPQEDEKVSSKQVATSEGKRKLRRRKRPRPSGTSQTAASGGILSRNPESQIHRKRQQVPKAIVEEVPEYAIVDFEWGSRST